MVGQCRVPSGHHTYVSVEVSCISGLFADGPEVHVGYEVADVGCHTVGVAIVATCVLVDAHLEPCADVVVPHEEETVPPVGVVAPGVGTTRGEE